MIGFLHENPYTHKAKMILHKFYTLLSKKLCYQGLQTYFDPDDGYQHYTRNEQNIIIVKGKDSNTWFLPFFAFYD